MSSAHSLESLTPTVKDKIYFESAPNYLLVQPAAKDSLSLLALIASRCNVSPKRLDAPAPSSQQIEQIFSAAAAAPDHGLLRPWRFVSIESHQRPALAKAFVLALLERSPGATQDQLEAASQKAARAPFLALAVFSPDISPSGIRPIEQTVSLGCAIQNILLAAQAMGFGSGLTSGQAMTSHALKTLFKLDLHEDAVCFIAIGSVASQKLPRLRPFTSDFLTALDI